MAIQLLLGLMLACPAQESVGLSERIRGRWRPTMEELTEKGVPGVSAAIVLPGGEQVTLTAGHSSVEADEAMQPTDRMLSGSVGKTYVSAAAHRLVASGELALDALAASYFEGSDSEWLDRVPNGRGVTLRQLLQHTSGIPRYVFEPAFFEAVLAEPDRVWRPLDLLAYVYDRAPLFAPGEGWAYSDTNYIVVGMVIERVAGVSFYDYVQRHFIGPLGLDDTVPSDRRRIPGVIQGYAVASRRLGFPERTLEDGAFVFNPQFEWCGGGFANTPLDLARWAGRLYGGGALEGPYLATLLDGVEAPALGPGVRYGLGAMIRATSAGRLVYHDGFMPGYLTTMGLFPESGIAAAVQINTDDARGLGRPLGQVMVELVALALEELTR